MAIDQLEWNDDYRVNVEEIDRQHRRLVELVNSPAKGVAGGYEGDILEHALFGMAA